MMKTKFFYPVLILLVFLAFCCSTMWAGPKKDTPSPELLSMMDEIKAINMINSLYLSPEQKAKLVKIGADAEKKSQVCEMSIDECEKSVVPFLGEMKKELVRGPQLSPGLAKRWGEIRDKTDTAMKANLQAQKEAVQKAIGVLSDNQKILVRQYTPCIVPVKSLREPDRVGQAANTEIAVKVLERARQVPDDRWSDAKKVMTGKFREKMALKVPEEELPGLAEKFGQSLEKARSLSPQDFEIQKDGLAEGFQHRKKEGKYELELKVWKFLISPPALSFLKSR
jgi:hypothetical protein